MLKPRPNHERYIDVLRGMTPEQRLQKAWELTETTRELLRLGLLRRHPELSEAERRRMYLARLKKCHNKNY